MRGLFTIVVSCIFFLHASSQTFTGTGGAIPGTSTTQTCFSRTVTGVGNINGSNHGLTSVCINLTHPYDDELEIVLTAPDGTVVPLSLQNGGSGNNYTNTCFSAAASNPIKFATAPFTGSFLPEGWLGAVNNGQNANGTWQLCIQDRRTAGNAGTLTNWSLTFSNTPAPVPPVMPACANTLPSTSSCSTATLVCDFNGQCGTTNGSSVQDWAGSGLDGCFGLQNNSFIRFIASATTASFSVWVPTSSIGTYNQAGIQMLFFSGTCNAGPVTTYGCYPHIMSYSAAGQPLIAVVTAAGLTPGNTYYLMIDGFNNDNCSFTIAANAGVNILNISPAAPAICAGSSVSLTASGGNGTYSWSPGTNLNTTSGATVTATPPATATYTVTSATVTGCPITKDVTVTVNTAPVAPTAIVSVQPSCLVATGTINITAPLGPGLLYSIDGTTYQAGTSFTGLVTNTYSVSVKDMATGCVSVAVQLTVNQQPSTGPVPVISIVQPDCNISTGTVTVNSPLGATYIYGIREVGSPVTPIPQSSPVFAGIIPGNYILIAQTAFCVNAVSFSINAAPALPAPTAVITSAPYCHVLTGTITVTAPLGANLEYSTDGTNYQTQASFLALPPATYSITVRNTATGCVSPATSITLNSPAPTPPTPVAAITTAVDCIISTATITVSFPMGIAYEYSLDGINFQSSPVFTAVPTGSYTISVRNTGGTCLTSGTSLSVNSAPPLLASYFVQSPQCFPMTGFIYFNTPLGPEYEYSVDNIHFQASPSFSNLPTGNYSPVVRNILTGCRSSVYSATIHAASAPPPAPAGLAQQPGCNETTGSISISSPLGAGYVYNLSPAPPFQASPLFSNLAPGTYYVYSGSMVTGCINFTEPLKVIINPPPAAPAAASFSITQPSCTVPTGSIIISSPSGTSLQYSINGTSYQAPPTFANLLPGNYNISVRNTAAGCVSADTTVTLKAPLPQDCITGTDIYFPTAFTANGDGMNDGFGPGPGSNVAGVSQYHLSVYNRYGELVFKTSDPYKKWTGMFKGVMLANYSYSWLATYRFRNGPLKAKTGTVILIR